MSQRQHKSPVLFVYLCFLILLVMGVTNCHSDGPHKPITRNTEKNTNSVSPGEGPVYAEVKSIFKERCSRCHNANPPGDWLNYEQISLRAKNGILTRRALSDNANMPPKGSPESESITKKEIALLKAWVNNGAPLNKGEIKTTAATPIASVESQCFGCHGENGISASDMYPHLAGQQKEYIVRQLVAFTKDQRTDATMQGIAKGLSQSDIDAVANYFSKQKPPCAETSARAEAATLLKRGTQLASNINCSACHTANNGRPAMPEWPVLTGQRAGYLFKQLSNFHSGIRVDSLGMYDVIKNVSPALNENDLMALAVYFSQIQMREECQKP